MRHRREHAEAIELRASLPTADGRLEVVASRIGERWWVVGRCGAWRGFGMHPRLGVAVDAALGPYAEGVQLRERADGD